MMDQFYVARFGNVRFLCLRDPVHVWYGTQIKRLAS